MHDRNDRIRRVVQPDGALVDQPTGDAPISPSCVASLMTSFVYCVREDARISAIADLLLDRGFSAVPVVDADGRPLGIVSKTDLLRHYQGRPSVDARASEMMMSLVFVVDQRASIGDAAALMATEGVHRVAVVDHARAVVGVLSALDLVRWLGQASGYAV